MPKEPEDMLEQNWITAASRVKESGAKEPVCQQHGYCTCQYWHSSNQQKRSNNPCPNKQRQPHEGHAWRPHIENCRNNINRAHD